MSTVFGFMHEENDGMYRGLVDFGMVEQLVLMVVDGRAAVGVDLEPLESCFIFGLPTDLPEVLAFPLLQGAPIPPCTPSPFFSGYLVSSRSPALFHGLLSLPVSSTDLPQLPPCLASSPTIWSPFWSYFLPLVAFQVTPSSPWCALRSSREPWTPLRSPAQKTNRREP
eukprot:Gb_04696 [translate_table: standard]